MFEAGRWSREMQLMRYENQMHEHAERWKVDTVSLEALKLRLSAYV